MARKVPAWQVAISEYSHEDYVYILLPEIGTDGFPISKIVHRLTAVDPEEQARLKKIRPAWQKEMYDAHVKLATLTHGEHSNTSCPPGTRAMCKYQLYDGEVA